MSDTLSTECYLVLQGRWNRYQQKYDDASVKRMTKKSPRLEGGQIAVKISLRLPPDSFDDFIPEALIEIPEECIHHPAIEASVISPEVDK